MYLIDTNIISELTKPTRNLGVVKWISQQESLVLSVISYHELRYGISMTMADSLIAATAIHHNRILVTRNVSDFKKCGLSLLNPFEIEVHL